MVIAGGEEMVSELGFKTLTIDNWLEPDEALRGFVRISPTDGKSSRMIGNDWLRAILEPVLVDAVPVEVKGLFEVARGVLAYGYFFYPLYTLGFEQITRVLEAAVTHKCKLIGASNSTEKFVQKIDYLIAEGFILEKESVAWHATRKWRNSASHPKQQQIILPSMVIGMVKRDVERINSLFNDSSV